ncbi:ABC transporter permease [Ruminococcus flavefaciens]|uniref:ABC transporter permease n=1 Tax=Ruminococcus flavefaciens TaxID=1265 RepID=UPI00049157B3|nr:ABC transporter permease [Ruminococcus flavefaciens]
MRDIITVAKKELKTFFSDKVILFQMIFLPFVIIFGYSSLMSGIAKANTEPEKKEVKAYYMNAPESFKDPLENLKIKVAPDNNEEKYIKDVKNKELDLFVIFPENFKEAQPGQTDLSNIDIYYNSEESSSIELFSGVTALFTTMQPQIFTVNASPDKTYDLVDKDAAFRDLISSFVPLMAFFAVFMICMTLAANSIAGDKENGFLNTLLVSPIRRKDLAIGKSVSILIVAIIASLSTFVGIILSLRKLSDAINSGEGVKYGVSEYLVLLMALVTGAFTLAAVLLIVSTLAKNVKQATTVAPIFLFFLMIPSLLSTIPTFESFIKALGRKNYIIPVWNSVRLFQDVLKLDFSMLNALITFVSNIIAVLLGALLIGHLFNKEKIVNG